MLFSQTKCSSFLGGLIRLIQSRSIKLIINRDSIHKNIKMNLEQNGFMYAFCENKESWQGNSIPYREDKKQDKDGLVDYLAEKWLEEIGLI